MATTPETLGRSVWTTIFVIVLLILVLGIVYLAY